MFLLVDQDINKKPPHTLLLDALYLCKREINNDTWVKIYKSCLQSMSLEPKEPLSSTLHHYLSLYIHFQYCFIKPLGYTFNKLPNTLRVLIGQLRFFSHKLCIETYHHILWEHCTYIIFVTRA
jgi:hypothetical protein